MGIDYGMGRTNIDNETGIRFGVIPSHYVSQAWADSAEPDYGDPTCPHCGNGVVSHDAPAPDDAADEFSTDDYETSKGCDDYRCDECHVFLDSEDVFGEEPNGFALDDGEYKATEDSDGDIFILKSPYFTRCGFCSPCAPGAGYLTDGSDDCRAYCFGPDWFDGAMPYDVYSVDTGELVAKRGEDSDE